MSVYILDPVCIQEKGHNLTAIKRYGSFLYELKKETIFLVISKYLQNALLSKTTGINVDRFFSNYYPDFIPLTNVEKIPGNNSSYKTEILNLAIHEMQHFFNKYKPCSKDTIFYPSIDYFSLAAIINFLETNYQSYLCKFIFRFIGVMEYDLYDLGISLSELLTRLGSLISNKKINAKISTESDTMADYIKDHIKQDVVITPTLVSHDYLAYPKNSKYTIVFPGSARRDKGFDRIESILYECEALGLHNYKAIVQLLPPSELELFSNHALGLVRNAKVTLLPCTLSENEIKELFAMADIVVAPYDKNVYRYRSSAIMAEAATYGRPIIASKDCGFSDQISRYKLGRLADSDEEFARGITYFFSKGDEFREDFGKKARNNFLKLESDSYTKLFL